MENKKYIWINKSEFSDLELTKMKKGMILILNGHRIKLGDTLSRSEKCDNGIKEETPDDNDHQIRNLLITSNVTNPGPVKSESPPNSNGKRSYNKDAIQTSKPFNSRLIKYTTWAIRKYTPKKGKLCGNPQCEFCLRYKNKRSKTNIKSKSCN